MQEQFAGKSLEELDLEDHPLITAALGALLGYLKRTQRTGLERMTELHLYSGAQFMRLDLNARRNWNCWETMRTKEKKGSLLWVLDQTKTAMGKRLIRSWLEQPLMSPGKIVRRQNAVEELVDSAALRDDVAEALTGVHDLERLMSRIVYGSSNARELRSLASALARLPLLRTALEQVQSSLLTSLREEIDPLEDVRDLIDRSIVDEPPFSRAGGRPDPGGLQRGAGSGQGRHGKRKRPGCPN